MSKKLFIIGNGFDIQHNIPSKYEDFHNSIKQLYSVHRDPFYIPGGGLVPKCYSSGYQLHDLEYILAYIDYTLDLTEKGDNWWNLEASLGNLKSIEEFDINSDDPFSRSYSNDTPENTIYYIGICFKILYELFNVWADHIDIKSAVQNLSFKNLINPYEDCFFYF